MHWPRVYFWAAWSSLEETAVTSWLSVNTSCTGQTAKCLFCQCYFILLESLTYVLVQYNFPGLQSPTIPKAPDLLHFSNCLCAVIAYVPDTFRPRTMQLPLGNEKPVRNRSDVAQMHIEHHGGVRCPKPSHNPNTCTIQHNFSCLRLDPVLKYAVEGHGLHNQIRRLAFSHPEPMRPQPDTYICIARHWLRAPKRRQVQGVGLVF